MGQIVGYIIVGLFIIVMGLCTFAPFILSGNLDEAERKREKKEP